MTAPHASSPVTRRRLLALSAAAGANLVLAPVLAQSRNPRVDEVIAAVPAVDLHSHAGGRLVNLRNASPFNVAERMKRGRFSVVTMAAVADRAVIGMTGGRIMAQREPRAGE